MRLVVGGDSYTYGHGLKDCVVNGFAPGPEPSKYAWPQVLASKLNVPLKNLAKPGHGNDFIINQFLSNDLHKTDIVIILWSFYTREMFFNKTKINHYGEWNEDFMRNKFTYSNPTDSFLKNIMNIATFTSYLASKSLKFYYAFLMPPVDVEVYKTYNNLKSRIIKNIAPYDISSKTLAHMVENDSKTRYPLAEDGSHPGEEWHIDLSDLIFTNIYKDTVKLI